MQRAIHPLHPVELDAGPGDRAQRRRRVGMTTWHVLYPSIGYARGRHSAGVCPWHGMTGEREGLALAAIGAGGLALLGLFGGLLGCFALAQLLDALAHLGLHLLHPLGVALLT